MPLGIHLPGNTHRCSPVFRVNPSLWIVTLDSLDRLQALVAAHQPAVLGMGVGELRCGRGEITAILRIQRCEIDENRVPLLTLGTPARMPLIRRRRRNLLHIIVIGPCRHDETAGRHHGSQTPHHPPHHRLAH